MKNKLLSFVCVLSFSLAVGIISSNVYAVVSPADATCPNSRKVCAIFDAVNAKVTPLPVTDMQNTVGLVIDQVEQAAETVKSGMQFAEKEIKMLKLSQSGFNLNKLLGIVQVPAIEDFTKGTETQVDAFKGKTSGMVLPVVDFTDNKQVARTVQEVAVVSNPTSSPERLADQERKDAFVQQSVLDVLARTLYYKNQLEELRKTDLEIQNIDGTKDTAGSIDISMRVKDVDQRVQALQEKIMAARLEVQAIRNLKSAEPVKEDIAVADARYGSGGAGSGFDLGGLFDSIGGGSSGGGGSGGGSSGGGSGRGGSSTGKMFTLPVLERLRDLAQNAINSIAYDSFTGYPASWNKVEYVDCINQNANRVKGDVRNYKSTKSKLAATLREVSSETDELYADFVANMPDNGAATDYLSSVRASYVDTVEVSQLALDNAVYATNSAVSMIISSLLVRIQDAIDADQHPAFIIMLCEDIATEAQTIVNDVLLAGTESVDHLTTQTTETLKQMSDKKAQNVSAEAQDNLNTMYQNANASAEASAIRAKNDIIAAGNAAQEVFAAIAQLREDLLTASDASGVTWDWKPGQQGYFHIEGNGR